MNKTNVIAIVGDSGSGKTYASMYLQMKFKWKAIVSYTTRPMREEEIQGREHWFVQPSNVPPKDKMCAYTIFGGYEYWTEEIDDTRRAVNEEIKQAADSPYNLDWSLKLEKTW